MRKLSTHKSQCLRGILSPQYRRTAAISLAFVAIGLAHSANAAYLPSSELIIAAGSIHSGNSSSAADFTVSGPSAAQIAVDPQSLSSTLPQGQSEIRDLTVSNPGGEPLEWHVSQEAAVTVTHSNSMDIEANNSVACENNEGTGTYESRYLRTFNPADFGISDEFNVVAVTFAIMHLSEAAPITVNLYTLDGAFLYSNMTLIGTATQELSAQIMSLVTMPVAGTMPPGSTLVVEIEAPDLTFLNGHFWPGMNDLGESAPSYIASEECGIFNPTAMADLGFPDQHLVMAVESPECTLPMWASIAPLEGLVLGGGSQVTNVAFDSSGMSPGDFQANLCISSNDTNRPLTIVPLVLRVTAPEIELVPQTLDFGILPLEEAATPQQVVIENVGPGDLVLETLTLEGLAQDSYSLALDACSNQTLQTGQSCSAEVSFTATVPGVHDARLRVPSNAQGDPHFVELTGSSDQLFIDQFEGPGD